MILLAKHHILSVSIINDDGIYIVPIGCSKL